MVHDQMKLLFLIMIILYLDYQIVLKWSIRIFEGCMKMSHIILKNIYLFFLANSYIQSLWFTDRSLKNSTPHLRTPVWNFYKLNIVIYFFLICDFGANSEYYGKEQEIDNNNRSKHPCDEDISQEN